MNDLVVFSLSSNKKVAKNVASLLHAQKGRIKIDHFKDGEVMVKNLSDVDGKDVIIIQSTSNPAIFKLFEILLLIDSLRRSGANKIDLYIPYYGYSRQERPQENEPVSAEVVAKILSISQADKIYTFDIHHNVIESFFKIPFISLDSAELFIDYFAKLFKKNGVDLKDVVVVSPDHGGNARTFKVHDGLKGSSMTILNKVRPLPNVAEHLEVDFDLKGKTCLIIDDIIDTGGTIISATKLLYSHGAKDVFVAATHGVFSKGSIEKLKAANIKKIIVTNTIEKRNLDKDVEVLDISPLIVKNL